MNAVGASQYNYVYVAGSFTGELPVGAQTLHGAGNNDIFILKLAP